jgi:hypothetical protein
MGEEDINVHDQWAVESMGAIQDRTREHLGTSDKVIMANRRTLLKAIETVQAGGTPPGPATPPQAAAMTGPDTVDGIAPAQGWEHLVARTGAGQARRRALAATPPPRWRPMTPFAHRCGVHDARARRHCAQATRWRAAWSWCASPGATCTASLRGKTLVARRCGGACATAWAWSAR